jgi:hypothetical protein
MTPMGWPTITVMAGRPTRHGRPAVAAPAAARLLAVIVVPTVISAMIAACSGPPASQPRQAPAARYLAIAEAGNRRLEIDFDGLHGRDRRNLAAAAADLRDAAATERLFDRRLLAIAFPPPTEAAARVLFRVNQARASLTLRAAASTSLRQLGGYEQRLNAANRPVEQEVRLIRRQLGLPPPETS